MCNFFEFDCNECYNEIKDRFHDDVPLHPTDESEIAKWLKDFMQNLFKPTVWMDDSKCYTLDRIVNGDENVNLTKYTRKKYTNIPSLVETLFNSSNENFGENTLNWASSKGYRQIYNKVGTESYNNNEYIVTMLKTVMMNDVQSNGWCYTACQDVIPCPDDKIGNDGVCQWGYNDKDFVDKINNIMSGDSLYAKNVLKLASCWKGNIMSDAMIDKLIEYCNGNSVCEERMKSMFDPMCYSDACSSLLNPNNGDNPYNFQLIFEGDCDGDLTFSNCNVDLGGSLVNGGVDCNICNEDAMWCGDNNGGGTDPNFDFIDKKKRLYIIGLIVLIIVIIIIIIILIVKK
jgi:hypothetical protein